MSNPLFWIIGFLVCAALVLVIAVAYGLRANSPVQETHAPAKYGEWGSNTATDSGGSVLQVIDGNVYERHCLQCAQGMGIGLSAAASYALTHGSPLDKEHNTWSEY